MARRARSWLPPALLAFAFAVGVALPLDDRESVGAPAIERSAEGDIIALADVPLRRDDASVMNGQWSENDDPDDILQADIINVLTPVATARPVRRVGDAASCQHPIFAAFPRGPPPA